MLLLTVPELKRLNMMVEGRLLMATGRTNCFLVKLCAAKRIIHISMIPKKKKGGYGGVTRAFLFELNSISK